MALIESSDLPPRAKDIEFSDLPTRGKDIALSDIMNHLKRRGCYPLGDRGVAPNTKFEKGNLVKISTTKSPNTNTSMTQYDGCWAIVVKSYLQYKNSKGKSNWYKKVPIYRVQHLYIIDSEDKPHLIGKHLKGFSWYWYHFSDFLTDEDALIKKKGLSPPGIPL